MRELFLVMAGGSLGALSRYGVSLLGVKLFGSRFPWGTLIVNLAGCFLIGFVVALAEDSDLIHPMARLFFVTGYLGALTTFSTYALETVNATRARSRLIALAVILSNNLAGIVLVFAGMYLGRARW
jgi:CrcB protein